MGHYFDASPTATSRPASVRLTLDDLTVDLATDRGVFSPDHVDTGTRVLLAAAPTPTATQRVLVDGGCGYGAIAVTLARRAPHAQVWAVDVNARARDLCESNAAAAGCSNVRVVTPDDLPDDLVVDGIWSNPPIRVGKAVLHELFTSWLGRLAPNASSWWVVHKHLGSDSLAAWIGANGWDVTRLTSQRGYRILEVSGR